MASQWCGGTVPGAVQAEPSTTDWCNSQLVLTVWPTCGGLSVRQHMKLGLTVCCKAVSTFLAESLCISNDWTCSPERWAGWDRGPTCFTQGKIKGYAGPWVCMPCLWQLFCLSSLPYFCYVRGGAMGIRCHLLRSYSQVWDPTRADASCPLEWEALAPGREQILRHVHLFLVHYSLQSFLGNGRAPAQHIEMEELVSSASSRESGSC